MAREKIFLQGQGKVREFHCKSGKNLIVVFEVKSDKSEILRVHIYYFLSIFIVF